MFSKAAMVSRYLLGLMFTIFGANGVMMVFTGHGFIPMPPQPAQMVTIMTGFMATGYIMQAAMLCELIAGILLLSGMYVNAAIILLGPVIVNILGIHFFAEPSGIPMALLTAVLYVILVASRWSDLKVLVKK
ncbi:MAG: DoxX protein [Rhizobacter sp.]|nr:DoxX protein [Bacteriovorax sp.]